MTSSSGIPPISVVTENTSGGTQNISASLIGRQTRNQVWTNSSCVKDKQQKELSSRSCISNDNIQRRADFRRDRIFLLNSIKSCGKDKNMRKATMLHNDVIEKNLIKDVYIATTLITTYAKCGMLEKAREVFDQLSTIDVGTWNAIIAGYVQHGLGHEALDCFRKMQHLSVSPSSVTYMCILKACGIVGRLDIGEGIDAEIREKELLQEDAVLGTALVDMYSKCGALEKARKVFENLPTRDVVAWSALISGYAQHGHGANALECFQQMQETGVRPNAVTYICILKACGIVGSLHIGENIDIEVRKQGLLHKHVVLGAALVDMYSKCGMLEKAQEVFEQLPVRNVGSWNALIAGYAQNGLGDEALRCLKQMQDVGVQPDPVTYICILKACGSVGSLQIGEDIDADVRKQGLLQKDVVLGTALVDMYSKCGALEKAREVFELLPMQTVVSWNALITGYVHHGLGDEALKCLIQMQNVGVCPDAITYICILKACAVVGCLEIGEGIDVEVRKQNLLQRDVVLGTALVDMYSKCGAMEKARAVFKQLPNKNIVTWNALITGYAQLGQANVVLDLYRTMRTEGFVPNLVTFIVLLTACSHAGLVKEGERLFDEMCSLSCLTPNLEHYTCMIDLFGRAGYFDKVKALFDKVSYSAHLPLYLNVLGACGKWRNVELGRWAFDQSVKLDEKCAPAYVCMQNIYAAAGMQIEAFRIELLRVRNKAWKISTCSTWIDANMNVHSFIVLHQSHPQRRHIHLKLEEIYQKLVQKNLSPGMHWTSQAISDDKNENVLCGHNDKLAIACALINIPQGTPIHVTKNVRLCRECHSTISLISMIEKCRIQVNDANYVHIFEDGKCICEND